MKMIDRFFFLTLYDTVHRVVCIRSIGSTYELLRFPLVDKHHCFVIFAQLFYPEGKIYFFRQRRDDRLGSKDFSPKKC